MDNHSAFILASTLRSGIVVGFLAGVFTGSYRIDASDSEILEAWDALEKDDPGPFMIDEVRGYIEAHPIFEERRDDALRILEAIADR